MEKLIDSEKKRLAVYKASSSHFSNMAKMDGPYRSILRPFCLPLEVAEENLYSGIRPDVLAYFSTKEIKWHDGQSGKPSNHLCDSQVCCVNFLSPFAHHPEGLKSLLAPIYPDIEEMLPIEDGRYVAFEWIGCTNYLGEMTRGGYRSRGANSTSADAAVMFMRRDGKQQMVLIEWKYTESYYSTFMRISRRGTDRARIHQDSFDSPDCPIDTTLLSSFDDLFYEPFYQLMRQQFLAFKMEGAKDLGADVVSLLHISPRANIDLQRVTSPNLTLIADTMTEVWGRLVKKPDRFAAVRTEELFGRFDIHGHADLRPWYEYITERYSWVKWI